MRIWCLAEISSAVAQNKNIVIKCGVCTLDHRTKTKYVFQSNPPLLYHIQCLVSVQHAVAQFDEDRVRILESVRSTIGFEEVNRRVRGSIVGALVSNKCAAIRFASVGNLHVLLNILKQCFGDGGGIVGGGGGEDKEARKKTLSLVVDALCAASACGNLELFQLIISYNEKSSNPAPQLLRRRDAHGLTPLMHAAKAGQKIIVNKIIEDEDSYPSGEGSLLDELNDDRWNALAFSCQSGCNVILDLLLTKGADPNIILNGGLNALGIGCQNNFSLACCERLIAAGAQVNHRDGVGYISLRHSVTPGLQPALVTSILKAGADPNTMDNWGETIISWAIEGTLGGVKALLDFDIGQRHTNSRQQATPPGYSNCDVNQVDLNRARTPLDKAIEKNNPELIRLITERGGLTLTEMGERVKGGCAKILTSNLAQVMKKFTLSREEAGLALSVKQGGRLDYTMESSSFPRPLQIVNIEEMIKSNNCWTTGIVTRGPDWDYPDDVDGGGRDEGVVGYISSINQQCVKDKKVQVFFPLGDKISERTHYLRAGANGKYDLVFAPYRYFE